MLQCIKQFKCRFSIFSYFFEVLVIAFQLVERNEALVSIVSTAFFRRIDYLAIHEILSIGKILVQQDRI